MSDPNDAHEFDPNRRRLCKVIVGSGICHQPADATVHQNWFVARLRSGAVSGRLTGLFHRDVVQSLVAQAAWRPFWRGLWAGVLLTTAVWAVVWALAHAL